VRELSDRDLIGRFVGEQDEEAFAQLVRRHRGMVYRVALRRCNGNHALAEDLAQSVMILLARKAGAAEKPFAELCRREFPVAVMGPGHDLVVPAELRFKSVDARRLVETVAASGDLKVKWIPEGRGVILYAGAPDSDVDSFLAQIGSVDVNERVAAARRGGWLEDPRVIPGLVKAARDDDTRVRRQARWSLGERLGWASAAILMPDKTTRLLQEEFNTPTRGGWRAAAGIAHLPRDAALGLIQTFIEKDDRAFSCITRCKNILPALRKTGGDDALALVLDIAENRTSDPRVLTEAFESLAERKGAAAIPIIDRILDSAPTNTSAAAIASRRTSAFGALAIAGDPRVWQWTEEYLQSGDPGTRHRAARALRASPGHKAFDLLTKALEFEDTSVRSAAVSALGEIGDSRAARLIEKRLQDDDASVQYVAVRSLCLLEKKKGLKLLTRVLGGHDERMRVAAVGAVGRIGGPEALALLAKALKDDAPVIRSAVARALGCLNGSAKVVSLLEQALQDEDANVRSAAVYGLSRLGGLQAMAALERAYESGPSDQRIKTALSRALGMPQTR